jgi:hypothetical protein
VRSTIIGKTKSVGISELAINILFFQTSSLGEEDVILIHNCTSLSASGDVQNARYV